MSIIRTPRPDYYTVINNTVFVDDEPLSWDAIGLLCYLLSKPDKWEVSPSALANTKRCGINKVHSLLKELRESRFVIGKKNVNGSYDYYVYDAKQSEDLVITPNHEKPDKGNNDKGVKSCSTQVNTPNHEKPNQEKPNQDLSRQVNTDNKQILKEKVNTDKSNSNNTREKSKSKKNAVAALEENHIKQTQAEVVKGQSYLDRFVNQEPYIDPNDIVLTDEQLGCYQWALADLRFWREKMNSKEAFMKHYGKPNSALKHQYETWLLKQQAQKSPAVVTSNTQGSNIIPFNGENYDTRNLYQQPQRKLSANERALEATRRGLERIEREEREAQIARQNDDSVVATHDVHLWA